MKALFLFPAKAVSYNAMRTLVLIAAVIFLLVQGCKESSKNPVAEHFESIKTDPSALMDFFQKMPKGGDIHHHASGSPYAESFIENALQDSLYIHQDTYQLYKQPEEGAVVVNTLLSEFPSERDSIIDAWSIRNYKELGRDGHDQFFGTFPKFMPAFEGYEGELLTQLCKKAAADNISYIETSITVPNVEDSITQISEGISFDPNEETPIESLLENWYNHYEANNMLHWAQVYADSMNSFIHKTDAHGVLIRFQGYGLRIYDDPPKAFGHLMLAFMGAELSLNIVGVNFVAPEDSPPALKNYETHMQMFRFLKEKHPSVNITLHAGELVLGEGEARPSDLKFHIDQALEVAGASRIGHGVDIDSETDKEEILRFMKEHGVAVEINLESNEVILERTPENHPIHTYREAGVPFSISTDDEGVLRTNLTNQYVLLVKYLPDVSYSEVKEIVYNSIRYSFLDDIEKQLLISDLDERFSLFEETVLSSK